MNLTDEPIAIAAGINGVATAVISVLLQFGVVHWTNEQQGAVLSLLAIGIVTGAAIARQLSTPTTKVALTKSDAELINAVKPAPELALVQAPTTVTVDPGEAVTVQGTPAPAAGSGSFTYDPQTSRS